MNKKVLRHFITFKLFIISTFVILLLSCTKNSLEEKIIDIMESELSSIKNYDNNKIIIILSDKNCYSCFYNYENIEADKYVAFYYSDNPLFLKKIKKINNKIKWNPIKNKNVLDLLFKFNNHSFGPYNFIFEKNKIKFINTIN